MKLRNSNAHNNELGEESSLGLFDNESRRDDDDHLMEIDDEPLGDLTPMPRQKHRYLSGSSVGALSRQRTPSPNFAAARGSPNSLQKQGVHPWMMSFDPSVAPFHHHHHHSQLAAAAVGNGAERSAWTRLIALLLCVLYVLVGALLIEYFQLPTTIARVVFTNPAFAIRRQ